MKRLLAAFALVILMALDASAQWYLFPLEEETKKEEKKEEVKVEESPAPVPVQISSEFVMDIPETINVTMLLPINLSKKPSSNFLEMYAGAMIAARDLGNQGTKINLSMYDLADEDAQISPDVLAESDVIIGPVASDDIIRMMVRAEGSTFISPLEPKAASLAETSSVIQAPSPWNAQIEDLVKWVRDEMAPSDQIVVVKDSTAAGMGEQAQYLMNEIASSGLHYRTVSSASAAAPQQNGDTRYIIVSDRDAFVATAVRQIGIASLKAKGNVYMYMTSKAHSAKGIETQYLYRANARYTSGYAVDYSSDKVKDFILAYRALFKDEPASFAFSGYDTVHYFVGACARYGREWYKKLPEYSESGLQADFRFKDSGTVGKVNSAVRRVSLSPDMLTSVQ